MRRLALADVQADLLKKIAADLGEGHEVLTLVVDVTDEADVQKMVDDTIAKFGRLDYAVNCAGIAGQSDSMSAFSLEMYEKVIAVNQRGVFLSMRAQLAALAKQDLVDG